MFKSKEFSLLDLAGEEGVQFILKVESALLKKKRKFILFGNSSESPALEQEAGPVICLNNFILH